MGLFKKVINITQPLKISRRKFIQTVSIATLTFSTGFKLKIKEPVKRIFSKRKRLKGIGVSGTDTLSGNEKSIKGWDD